MKVKYYTTDKIDATGAQYRVIIGERSNGKTYALKKRAIDEFINKGKQTAYVRRWDLDFKEGKGAAFFDDIVENGYIEEVTYGQWSCVVYKSKKWYFAKPVEDKEKKYEICPTPFMVGFALTMTEHGKGDSYPNINTIVFDEFIALSSTGYLPSEFMLFMNTINTIVRLRDNVVIYMLGNTINKYCPYFNEFGISKLVKDLKQSDLEVIKFGETGLKLAIEFSDFDKKQKKSNIYFAFDNPSLSVIRGDGSGWQLELYPHCPMKYYPKNIIYTFFIIFDGETFQCEVITVERNTFIYIHRKTTPLKSPDKDLIYSLEYSPKPNYRRKITKQPQTKVEQSIIKLFSMDKVFYQDNEVGQAIRNYITECKNV